MRAICFLFLILLATAVGVFAYQNNYDVSVTVPFVSHSPEVSFPLLVGGAYLLGMLSGWTVVGMLKRSWQRVTEPDRR